MRERKHNIEWRRGRQGEGFYLDFTVRGRRLRAFGGQTLREARLELGRLRAEKTSEKAAPPKDIGFEEFGREFMRIYSRPNKRSWQRDEVSLRSMGSFFKGRALRSITAQDIEVYKAQRLAMAKKNMAQDQPEKRVSPATTNRELALIKTMMTKAVEWGRLESSPAVRTRKLKEPPPRERVLTEAEAGRLVGAAAPHLKTLLVLLLGTGMRKGEALGLRWEDVDFDRSFIHIGDSKNGRPRNVPMSSMVRGVLAGAARASDLVFNGLRDIKRSFKTALKGARIKGVRLHDLRHTAASRMVQAGVDLVTVSKILGHSSIQMTMRYAHPTPENMLQAVEKLSEKLPANQWIEATSSRQVESTSIN